MYTYIRFFLPMLLGWCCAQIPKVTYKMLHDHPGNLFQTIVSSGGMPSTHTASTMGLVTYIGFSESFRGPLFALSIVFALVTMYDAFNVRLACGKVTARVNQLTDKLCAEDEDKPEPLPVVNGHTFAEVAVGFFIGVAAGAAYALLEQHFIG